MCMDTSRRKFNVLFLGGFGSLINPGCLYRETADKIDYDIGMSSSAFLPNYIKIKVGQTIKWINNNSRAHTITAYENRIPENAPYFASGGFSSENESREIWNKNMNGSMGTGEIFEHRFTVAGKYHYFCIPHEIGGMIGIVEVEE